jgi:hypothetical protein
MLIPVSYISDSDQYYYRRITSFEDSFIQVFLSQLGQLFGRNTMLFRYYEHIIAKEKSLLLKFAPTRKSAGGDVKNSKKVLQGIRRTKGYDYLRKSGPPSKCCGKLNKFIVDNDNAEHELDIAALTALLNFKVLDKKQDLVRFHEPDTSNHNAFRWLKFNIYRLKQFLCVEDPTVTGQTSSHYFFNIGMHKTRKAKSGAKTNSKKPEGSTLIFDTMGKILEAVSNYLTLFLYLFIDRS